MKQRAFSNSEKTDGIWTTEMPVGWKSMRLKFVASINDETLPESTDPEFEFSYVDIGSVDFIDGITSCESMRFQDAPSRARRRVRPGDVIVSTVRTYLRAIAPIQQTDGELIVSTGFAVVRPVHVHPPFLAFALRESSFVEHVMARSVGVSYPAVTASEIGDIQIPIPPLEQQVAIAEFLGQQTEQIDALVAQKRHMLRLLEEKRAALISTAVTHGVDPTVPTKHTEIPWLTEIPAHWKLLRIKHFAVVGNGSTPNVEKPQYWEGGEYPWLNSSVVASRKVDEPSRYITDVALRECHLPRIKPPALLVAITGQGKTRGKSTVLEFEATINQHLAFVQPDPLTANCLYLSFLLDSAYSYFRSESDGAGSTRGAITCEQLGQFHVCLPPVDEQNRILKFVEHNSKQYADLEEALRISIRLLHDRRSALISAAVRGHKRAGNA
jgi:type I restriction enzyme S subunit